MWCAGSLSKYGSGLVSEAYGSSGKNTAVVTFESEVQPSVVKRVGSRRLSVDSLKTESQYDTADDESTSREISVCTRKIQAQSASVAKGTCEQVTLKKHSE